MIFDSANTVMRLKKDKGNGDCGDLVPPFIHGCRHLFTGKNGEKTSRT